MFLSLDSGPAPGILGIWEVKPKIGALSVGLFICLSASWINMFFKGYGISRCIYFDIKTCLNLCL